MKQIILAVLGVQLCCLAICQVKPAPKKPASAKTPSSSEIDRMMEEAMKGMSKEEQEEMKKMMKSVQPAMQKMINSTADYPEFTDNLSLVPLRDQTKIASISNRAYTPAEIKQQTQGLFTKLMVNAPAEEKNMINQVITKHHKGDALMAAASTAFLMGHRPAAAGLAMKAVLADEKNLVYQNNLAAILTQTGYPEKAIPYLNTLLALKPGNSTLNNNLGYAWFYLGETDSASKYIQFALRRNPAHAEAQLCAGVIAESQGDDAVAVHGYEEAFTETASHQAANLMKNKNKKDPATTVDYERLIRSITIFEYFDSSWVKIPEMENKVEAWERNKAVLTGLDSMHERLGREITGFRDQANAELDKLMKDDKSDGQAFATEMMNASLDGLNMMSKPALYIIAILSMEYKRYMQEIQDSALALGQFIEQRRKIRDDVPDDAKCPLYDAKANEYMAAVNPRIKKFWDKHLEKFRVWINAWCTWRWYIVGNVKKSVTVELLGWELAFLQLRSDALNIYQLEKPHCRSTTDPEGIAVDNLEYYYTECVPEVKLPFSISTLEASANAAKMNDNAFGMKYTGKPIPNATMTYGVSGSIISEPGLYSNPGIKTSEGGMTPLGMNQSQSSPEDELVPLPKLPPTSEDDLVPLPRLPKVTDDDLVPLPKGPLLTNADKKALAQARISRIALNKKLTRNCLTVGTGQLEMPTPRFVVGIGELSFDESMIFNEETGEWEKREGKIIVGEGELIFEDLPSPKDKTEPSRLQTVISNGMEILKTTAKSVINLFK